MVAKKLSDVIDVDRLGKLLKLPNFEKLEEHNQHYLEAAYSAGRQEASNEGLDDDAASERGIEFEGKARHELYVSWRNAVVSAANKLFEQHHLELVDIQPKQKGADVYQFKIAPTKSWDDAAAKILDTLNGVGYFSFPTVRAFLAHGPYTARQAVLSHLGWIPERPRVYDDSSALTLYQHAFR